jgi:taurine dioxygenase
MMVQAQSERIVATPLSASIGAEINSFDVKRIGVDIDTAEVQKLLYEHQLLCFRDQDLQPADLVRFTSLFGPPDPHVLQQYTLPDYPQIFVISNIVENGRPLGSTMDGFGWHTDLTYLPLPAAYTILYGLEVPPEGAETLFASMYKAYDALEEAEKRRLRPLKGVFSYLKLYGMRKNAPPLTSEQRARTPDVVHPLVRVHPHSGREGMYVNRDDCIGVEGMNLDEGIALIQRLFDFTVQNFAYTHRWRVRDLLIWDNRGALHAATPYDMERHRRLVYRTTVQGEKPIAWAAA